MYKLLPILLFAYGFAITTEDIYDNSYALVIGIDKYKNVSNLDYAVKDAESVANLLKENFNFSSKNIKTLLNEEATLSNIKNSLSEIAYSAKENDRVLIYFAGHGITDDLPDGGEMGYLLPIDGKPDKLFATSIPMDDLKRISSMSASKHMLFLIDACYGGLAATGARGIDSKTPNYIDKITRDKSRQIITAGGRGEQVIEKSEWGHSAFTLNLIRALEDGKADLNDDGYITAEELGVFLKEKVSIDSENQQTPISRRFTSHEGEFVFINNMYIENQVINISPKKENILNVVNELKGEISLLKEELSKPVSFIQVQGCTDEMAVNYNPNANIDDDSCIRLDSSSLYVRFGEYDYIDSILTVFIKSGRNLNGFPLNEYNFTTEGFNIIDIHGGDLYHSDSNWILSKEMNSKGYFTNNYKSLWSSIFPPNIELLLFKAKVFPYNNQFCLNDFSVNNNYEIGTTTEIYLESMDYKVYVDDCLNIYKSGEGYISIYYVSNTNISKINFTLEGDLNNLTPSGSGFFNNNAPGAISKYGSEINISYSGGKLEIDEFEYKPNVVPKNLDPELLIILSFNCNLANNHWHPSLSNIELLDEQGKIIISSYLEISDYDCK